MDRFRFGKKMPKRQQGETEAAYQERVKQYMAKLRDKLKQEGK